MLHVRHKKGRPCPMSIPRRLSAPYSISSATMQIITHFTERVRLSQFECRLGRDPPWRVLFGQLQRHRSRICDEFCRLKSVGSCTQEAGKNVSFEDQPAAPPSSVGLRERASSEHRVPREQAHEEPEFSRERAHDEPTVSQLRKKLRFCARRV